MESLPTQRVVFQECCNRAMPRFICSPRSFTDRVPAFAAGLFVAGALPALLVLYIRARVPESPVWQRNKERRQHLPPDIRRFIRQHGTLFIHVVLLMTAFNYMSHGTQDLYATFLERQRGFGVSEKSMIAIIYAIGATAAGQSSVFYHNAGTPARDHFCAVCGMLLIPAWVFAPGTALLIVELLMHSCAGAGRWPVHLNEVSPAIFAGFRACV